MILQRAFDLLVLAEPFLLSNGSLSDRIVLLSTDELLQLLRIDVVGTVEAKGLLGSADTMLAALARAGGPHAAYFALVHASGGSSPPEPALHEQGAAVAERALLSLRCRMLAHVLCRPDGWVADSGTDSLDLYGRFWDRHFSARALPYGVTSAAPPR